MEIKKVELKKKINPKEIMKERKEKSQRLVDSLDKELEDKGVVFFKPVDMGGTLDITHEYLTLPSEITDVPSKDLGEYLNAFTMQKIYMRTLIGWQEIVVEEKKRTYYNVSYEMYEEMSKTKLSETAKERLINNAEGVKDEYLALRDEVKKLSLLKYNIESIEDSIFLISREVSRRSADLDEGRRIDNVSKKRYK